MLEHTIKDAENDLAQPEARRAKELRRVVEYLIDTARECVGS